MTISMAYCIGKSGCDRTPGARGLCSTCYMRHKHRGTLKNFPTMRERAQQLRASGDTVLKVKTAKNSQLSADWRKARYAERVRVEGYLVHPESPHGTLHSYISYGCRGPMCGAAQRWQRDTGESRLPITREQTFGPEDCIMFDDPRYIQ